MEAEDRTLAEDFACPVDVQPGLDYAAPEDWGWRRISSSQPSKAIFHVNHHDATRVLVDVLHPGNSPSDASFVLTQPLPIVIIDSLDKYWAGESRSKLPLRGLRVPVEADTLEEAKRALEADLAAQFRLLLLLSSSSGGKLAPQLRENLACLSQYFAPRRVSREGEA